MKGKNLVTALSVLLAAACGREANPWLWRLVVLCGVELNAPSSLYLTIAGHCRMALASRRLAANGLGAAYRYSDKHTCSLLIRLMQTYQHRHGLVGKYLAKAQVARPGVYGRRLVIANEAVRPQSWRLSA